jgi:hypothetical protein
MALLTLGAKVRIDFPWPVFKEFADDDLRFSN